MPVSRMATDTLGEPKAPPAQAASAWMARMFHCRANSTAFWGAVALSVPGSLVLSSSVSLEDSKANSTSGSTSLTPATLASRAAPSEDILETTANPSWSYTPSSRPPLRSSALIPELAALPGLKTTRYRPDSPGSVLSVPAAAVLSCMVRLPAGEAFPLGLTGACSTHAAATIAPAIVTVLQTNLCMCPLLKLCEIGRCASDFRSCLDFRTSATVRTATQ